MKTVDHLFHINCKLDVIKDILVNGFMPSYAREHFGRRSIMVPMVSFSNILLRDVGEKEVLNYGSYGLGFSRQWGIDNNINPVIYTYENGILEQAIDTYFYNSLFLANLGNYREKLNAWSKGYQKRPEEFKKFSERITLTNTPKEVMDILDHLSTNYNEDLLNIIINYAYSIRQATITNIKLAKPYKVKNAKGQEFIAYNDREWRKIYDDLDFLIDGSEEYEKWNKTEKPHFNDEKHRLRFSIGDVKSILVENEDEVKKMTSFLNEKFGENKTIIGTKQQLIEKGF